MYENQRSTHQFVFVVSCFVRAKDDFVDQIHAGCNLDPTSIWSSDLEISGMFGQGSTRKREHKKGRERVYVPLSTCSDSFNRGRLGYCQGRVLLRCNLHGGRQGCTGSTTHGDVDWSTWRRRGTVSVFRKTTDIVYSCNGMKFWKAISFGLTENSVSSMGTAVVG